MTDIRAHHAQLQGWLKAGWRSATRYPGSNMVGNGLTRFLAMPWIDPLCLLGMGWILPAARCWAAAGSGDVAAFAAELSLPHVSSDMADRVRQTAELRQVALAAQAQWIAAAFDGVGDLPVAERYRREAAHTYIGQRLAYLWFARRNRVHAAKLDVPAPHEIEALIDTYGDDPDAFFAPWPEPVAIERSQTIEHADVKEYWLRLPSPDAPEDTCWVHVYEGHSKNGAPIPSLIFGHGLAMEMEMMRGDMRGYRGLAARGCRILLPDAPGHNRRVAAGQYGGESFMCRPPLSGLLHFQKSARELAAIIAWCHETQAAPVALGGISLGALTAQVAAQHLAHWPAISRPDAMMLLTTTDKISSLTFTSSLAKVSGLGTAARKAGWADQEIALLGRFTDTVGPAPIDPAKIVLMLGTRDDVTPYDGGKRLAECWNIPPDNLFVRGQGHFSAAIGLGSDPAPFGRILAILKAQIGGSGQ
ncbi:MAG: hypothetical protein IPK59_05085 [Rhodospirillaceae bacterium]|nr:hypothetical protein [Rhodospirillaceae bacterium]